MKKALVVLAALAAILTAGTLSINHYQKYQNKQIQAQQNAVDELAKKVSAYEVKQHEVIDGYNQLRIECEKGQAAYDALTPAQRTKTPDPTCGPVLVK